MMKNNQFTLEGFGSVEEILGAYIEGHLSEAENHQVAELIGKNEELSDLVSEVTDFTDYWYDDADATPDIDNFELPELEYSDGNLISIEGIDLNSKFDINNNLNNEDIMLETLEIDNESLGNSAHAAIYEANKHYGLEPVNIDFDPDTYQWEKDTCAIRSQEIVLRSFGVFVPQDELIAQAEANGWYSKGHGTPMSDVGNLLDLYNVPNHRVADANVFNLIDELGHGHKVIVGVDIHELYGNPFWQSIKETLVGKTPNHAMIVSGIDTSNPDKPMVTLTDPGTGKTLFECPYEKFLSAWDDSSCFMVATDKAAPLEYNTDTMMNFDYQNGHLASVGKIPFDYFQDSIAPEAEEYIDSLDEYIDSVEKLINNGFSSQELFDDMMNKSEKAHHHAEEMQKMHHEEDDDNDDNNQNKPRYNENLTGNFHQNHEKDDIDDDDNGDEDINF